MSLEIQSKHVMWSLCVPLSSTFFSHLFPLCFRRACILYDSTRSAPPFHNSYRMSYVQYVPSVFERSCPQSMRSYTLPAHLFMSNVMYSYTVSVHFACVFLCFSRRPIDNFWVPIRSRHPPLLFSSNVYVPVQSVYILHHAACVLHSFQQNVKN